MVCVLTTRHHLGGGEGLGGGVPHSPPTPPGTNPTTPHPPPLRMEPNFLPGLWCIRKFSGAFSANYFRPKIFFGASKNSARLGGGESSNGEPLSSPESKRATMQHIHPRTTPTNTSGRSICRFGDMCKSARCPWHHPTASGTTQQPQGDAGSDMLPPRRRTPEAVSMPAEKERARNWEECKQQNNWAQVRPTHGSETSPNRTHNKTQKQPASGGGCLPQPRWAVCATGVGADQP